MFVLIPDAKDACSTTKLSSCKLVGKLKASKDTYFAMESLCKRFPYVIELVLDNLDDKNLVNCREASREMQEGSIQILLG